MAADIRTAVASDVPALVAAYDWLFAAPGAPAPGWDRQVAAARLHELLGQPERFTAFVADDAGSIAGFVTAYLDILSVRFGQRVWVEDLAVAPDHRSAGIGKALLDAAKAWARERGASHLELDSAFTRTDAHRFYERERPSMDGRVFSWFLTR